MADPAADPHGIARADRHMNRRSLAVSLVYRDYDQQTLDLQYNNQAHVADPKRYLDWYATASERARARVKHRCNIAYGGLPDERLDIFMPDGATAADRRPVVVFVHGGAWRHLDRSSSSFAAETFTSRGALFIALGFSRMPAAGSLDEMVAQVRTAIAWICEHIEAYGGDSSRLFLLAHSSGAHLAGMAIGTDWPRLFGLPAQIIRAAALVGGIYDLEPVRLSSRNEMLKLDRASEIRNSPCRNLPPDPPPVLIAFGEKETAEFRRQSRDFARLYSRRTQSVELLELAGLNHYETVETLAIPDRPLSLAAVRTFKLV
jgi:arylformamidase